MPELKHPLLTNNYTIITHEENPQFGAPHHFQVQVSPAAELAGHRGMMVKVDFQEGPIKEHGVNGIANEDALVMVLARLQGFQSTPYACEENAQAITHIEAALTVLRERTNKRVARNVEGTHIV